MGGGQCPKENVFFLLTSSLWWSPLQIRGKSKSVRNIIGYCFPMVYVVYKTEGIFFNKKIFFDRRNWTPYLGFGIFSGLCTFFECPINIEIVFNGSSSTQRALRWYWSSEKTSLSSVALNLKINHFPKKTPVKCVKIHQKFDLGTPGAASEVPFWYPPPPPVPHPKCHFGTPLPPPPQNARNG